MNNNGTKQPKFKVGDVIEVTDIKGRCAVTGAKGKIAHIAKTKVEEIINGEFYGLPDGEFYIYEFEWFEHPEDFESGIESWFRLCKGVRNKRLCSECEYGNQCPQSGKNNR
jgi:hypothetical protein